MITHFTKSELVFNKLLEMIHSGELKPGEKISAVEIAATLGVSRTPVNEAVKRLADRKLVAILPNVGFQITVISPDEVLDLYELKMILESTAIRWLGERGIMPDIGKLRKLNESIRSALEDGDRTSYNMAVRSFHSAFVASAGSRPLLDSFMGIWEYSGWEDTLFQDMSPELAVQCDEHNEMLDCLIRKDHDGARKILLDHGKRWIELYKSSLKKRDGDL